MRKPLGLAHWRGTPPPHHLHPGRQPAGLSLLRAAACPSGEKLHPAGKPGPRRRADRYAAGDRGLTVPVHCGIRCGHRRPPAAGTMALLTTPFPPWQASGSCCRNPGPEPAARAQARRAKRCSPGSPRRCPLGAVQADGPPAGAGPRTGSTSIWRTGKCRATLAECALRQAAHRPDRRLDHRYGHAPVARRRMPWTGLPRGRPRCCGCSSRLPRASPPLPFRAVSGARRARDDRRNAARDCTLLQRPGHAAARRRRTAREASVNVCQPATELTLHRGDCLEVLPALPAGLASMWW